MCPSSSKYFHIFPQKYFENFWSAPTGMLVRNCVSFKEQMQCHRLTHPLKKTKARSTFLDRQVFCDFLIRTVGFLSWLTIIITFPAFIKHTGTGIHYTKQLNQTSGDCWVRNFFQSSIGDSNVLPKLRTTDLKIYPHSCLKFYH